MCAPRRRQLLTDDHVRVESDVLRSLETTLLLAQHRLRELAREYRFDYVDLVFVRGADSDYENLELWGVPR